MSSAPTTDRESLNHALERPLRWQVWGRASHRSQLCKVVDLAHVKRDRTCKDGLKNHCYIGEIVDQIDPSFAAFDRRLPVMKSMYAGWFPFSVSRASCRIP